MPLKWFQTCLMCCLSHLSRDFTLVSGWRVCMALYVNRCEVTKGWFTQRCCTRALVGSMPPSWEAQYTSSPSLPTDLVLGRCNTIGPSPWSCCGPGHMTGAVRWHVCWGWSCLWSAPWTCPAIRCKSRWQGRWICLRQVVCWGWGAHGLPGWTPVCMGGVSSSLRNLGWVGLPPRA